MPVYKRPRKKQDPGEIEWPRRVGESALSMLGNAIYETSNYVGDVLENPNEYLRGVLQPPVAQANEDRRTERLEDYYPHYGLTPETERWQDEIMTSLAESPPATATAEAVQSWAEKHPNAWEMFTEIASNPSIEQNLETLPLVGPGFRWAANTAEKIGAKALAKRAATPDKPVPKGQSGAVVAHGSPHEWEEVDLSKVGTGQGAQAYGYGFYSAENPKVAQEYARPKGPAYPQHVLDEAEVWIDAWNGDEKKALREMKIAIKEAEEEGTLGTSELLRQARDAIKAGRHKSYLYELDLPDEKIGQMLDLEKPLSEQAESIKKALLENDLTDGKDVFTVAGARPMSEVTGMQFYDDLATLWREGALPVDADNSQQAASRFLNSIGIPGNKYLDAGSRPTNVTDQRLYALLDKHGGDPEAAVDEFMGSVYNTPKEKAKMRDQFLDKLRKGQSRNFVTFDAEHTTPLTRNGQPIPRKQRGMFIGTEGLERLKKAGVDTDQLPESVGKDGKPRWEISDEMLGFTAMIPNWDESSNSFPMRMDKAVSHPELFTAYPQLRDVLLKVKADQRSGQSGSFNPSRRQIDLDMVEDPQTLGEMFDASGMAALGFGSKRTLGHELQHGVQHIEGHDPGTSPLREKLAASDFPPEVWDEVNEKLAPYRQFISDDMTYSDLPGPVWVERLLKGNEPLLKAMPQSEIKDLLKIRDKYRGTSDYDAAQRYHTNAGEVEARNTERRLKMNLEQRRALPPTQTESYPRERQWTHEKGAVNMFDENFRMPGETSSAAGIILPALLDGPNENWVDPSDVTMENLEQFMGQHGLPGAGKLSKIETVGGEGASFDIPGGLQGDFTYADLQWLKANPIDASTLPREIHTELQKKLARSTSPKGSDMARDRVDTFNRYLFGMLSPNQPLTPNEFEASILRARSPEDIKALGDRINWEPGEAVDPAARKAINDQMAIDFKTAAGSKGGLGLKGSADYTNISEFAKLYQKDPDFFVKAEDESWANFNERVMTQVRGLSSKVAAFSTVWQDPLHAAISAVDRHMARKVLPDLFKTKKSRADWERSVTNRYNDLVASGEIKGGKKVRNLDEVLASPGGDGVFMERVMSLMPANEAKYRVKGGGINPNISENLKETKFIVEPAKVQQMSAAYKRAQDVNNKWAEEHGLGLFSSQWLEWDRLRRRLEPHEVMYPGLHKLPKMPIEDTGRSIAEHKKAGYFNSSKEDYLDPDTGELSRRMKPTKRMDINKSLYWGAAGGALAPILKAMMADEEETQ